MAADLAAAEGGAMSWSRPVAAYLFIGGPRDGGWYPVPEPYPEIAVLDDKLDDPKHDERVRTATYYLHALPAGYNVYCTSRCMQDAVAALLAWYPGQDLAQFKKARRRAL